MTWQCPDQMENEKNEKNELFYLLFVKEITTDFTVNE